MSESVVQCLKISIVKTLTDSPCGDELRRTRGYGSQFTQSKIEKKYLIICLFVLSRVWASVLSYTEGSCLMRLLGPVKNHISLICS